ncbi:MAG: T9SS type A sorting domain-containing protein [Ignavibacteria bacterium]|nr:T9SS type A sorting domain-containing protein [Ignavibacteria bacterium]
MKVIILITIFCISFSTGAQSVLTLQPGTSMGVTTGANLCVNVINGSGMLYGGGTICGGLVAIEPVTSNEIPASFDMQQNYPNPFNPVTVIKYQIPQATYLTVKLYDQLGREILTLFAGDRQAGYYELTVDGTNLASGIYFCRLISQGFSKIIKMSLIK